MHHLTIKPRQTVALDDTFIYAGKCYRVCRKIAGCAGCVFHSVTCIHTPDCHGVIFKVEPNPEE